MATVTDSCLELKLNGSQRSDTLPCSAAPRWAQVLAPVIGIFNSIFLIIFVAHILGCAFTMIANAEPEGPNWLTHYDPALPEASNETRYVVALYWAMIRSPLLRRDQVPCFCRDQVLQVVQRLSLSLRVSCP